MTFEIVPMTEQHIERAAALERECFSAPWSENSLREELSNEQSHFLCAMSNGSFAGYVGVQEIAGEAYITNVAVFPEYRRRGAGKELLTAAEHGASERAVHLSRLKSERATRRPPRFTESSVTGLSEYAGIFTPAQRRTPL